ncbi:MAG: nucleotidyltransferase domain-containing protein [Myxococcota bacterium]
MKQWLIDRLVTDFAEWRLFGSFARGEQQEESDIDVLVAKRGSRRKYQQMVEDEIGFAPAVEEEGIVV